MKSNDTNDLDALIAPALRPASDSQALRERLLQRAADSRTRHQEFPTGRR